MITGIIMASGFSSRMGENKLLLELGGKKIIEYVIEATIKSKLDDILLIYRDEEVYRIGKSYGIRAIYNERADLGQSQSVILGVKNSRDTSYMFLVGDQPFISNKLIDLLIDEFNINQEKIIIPSFKDKNYMPIIFPKKYRKDLLSISGDKGGREIIKNNPQDTRKIKISNEKLLIDIDTLDEYNSWKSSNL